MNECGCTLTKAFDIGQGKEVLSFVGGGGKTTLMFALAKALDGNVVATTTTRIFASQMKTAPAVCYLGPSDWRKGQLSDGPEKARFLDELSSKLKQSRLCLVVGRVQGDKALGIQPPEVDWLAARPDVNYVLVEADGSRMRPCKAPAEHEPVIPDSTSIVVPIVGVDAVGTRISKAAHRPELVSKLTGLNQDDVLTAEALARLVTHPQGGFKSVPGKARVIPCINKVDTEGNRAAAREVAGLILKSSRAKQVVLSSARTANVVREVHRRVTAVVLAAGESKRLEGTKQLLAWEDSTMLGKTLQNLQQSEVTDIVVVTGFDAERIEMHVKEFGVRTIRNPQFHEGEMLSSLQTALRTLDPDQAAIMVVLADQPMIGPAVINRLLGAYWECRGDLLAPAFNGRRGNPVLFGRRFFEEILALPAGKAPRDMLRRHASELCLVEAGTPVVLEDIDTFDDYNRLHPID